MANYKLIVAYDGTRYKGWQRLTNTEDTIQGKLEKVLCKMTSDNIQVIGTDRTDGGAHARAQVANFQTNFKASPEEFFKYLTSYLPKDIAVISVKNAEPRFHAQFNSKSIRYVYQIRTGLTPNPFDARYRLHVPEKLDFDLMTKACSYFIGTHDFQSFTSRKSKTKSNKRTITRLELVRDGNNLDIIFEASGFLPNMVRIITGTIIEIGLGKTSINDIENIFNQRVRAAAGYTVPPYGLFLDEVMFD